MKKLAVILFVFNIIDAVATAFVLKLGIGIEYNPLVKYLYSVHPFLFVVAKLSLLSVGISVAIARAQEKGVRVAFLSVTVFYGLLSLYQIFVLTFWWSK